MNDENENWARGERLIVLLDEVCRYWETNEHKNWRDAAHG
jgi:hypothetical protein